MLLLDVTQEMNAESLKTCTCGPGRKDRSQASHLVCVSFISCAMAALGRSQLLLCGHFAE